MGICPYNQHLSAYHDGELPAKMRQDIEYHLPLCGECSAELAQIRHLSAALASAPWPRLSIHQKQDLYALSPTVGEAVSIRISKWTAALAASVLLAASTWVLVRQATTQPAADQTSHWLQVAVNPPQSADPQSDLSLPDWVESNLSTTNQP